MNIEHIALWVRNLELMKAFYIKYTESTCSPLYHNEKNKFKSYFLNFDSGCRLELMYRPDIEALPDNVKEFLSYTHIAISTGSKAEVDRLTQRLSDDGYKVIGKPRVTGDGYYESVILDPELNRVEITI